LAATKRPTSCSRIGSDGSALHNSFRGEVFDGCSTMKQMLHICFFGATFDTRASTAHGRDRVARIVVL
jgi:hypothetical protein